MDTKTETRENYHELSAFTALCYGGYINEFPLEVIWTASVYKTSHAKYYINVFLSNQRGENNRFQYGWVGKLLEVKEFFVKFMQHSLKCSGIEFLTAINTSS